MDFIMKEALKSSPEISWDEALAGQAKIKVMGAGGAGNNAADWLYRKGIKGAEIIAINTDKQHLDAREADIKILIGKECTRGLGAGGFPEKGEEACREDIQEIKSVLKDTDMIFLVAGMGGGTGTGSAPVVAEIAKEMGAIVIGVVTMPFKIERARIDKAEWGLDRLRKYSDTVIVIDNNRLVDIAGTLPISQAFAVANELVATMIKGIVETIALPSLVNLDFADVKAIMTNGGVSAIGVGESDTEGRVEEAVRKALMNPLLDVSYEGADGALIHITGGEDLTLDEVNKAGEMITTSLDADAQVIWGARITPEMNGKLRVMTIITGVNSPFILGPHAKKQLGAESQAQMNDELGIRMISR